MHKDIIIKNAFLLTLQEIIFNVLGVIFYILLARRLGENGLGTYSYVLSLISFLGLFLDFGIGNIFWRKWLTTKDSIQDDINTFIQAKLFITIPITIIFFLYSYFFERQFLLFLTITYFAVFLDIFRSSRLNYLVANNKFEQNFLVNFVDRFLSLGGGILLIFLNFGVLPILILYTTSRLISTLLSLKFVKVQFSAKFDLKKIIPILKLGFPSFIMIFLSTFYFKIDNIFIKHFLGIDSVGLYNSAYRIFELFLIIPNIIALASLPTIKMWMATGDLKRVHKSLNYAIKYITLFGSFITFIFVFYNKEILHFLYGENFIQAGVILEILGITLVPLLIANFVSLFLYAHEKEYFLIGRLILLSFLNVILNLLLITRFGVVGSAVATLITEVVNLVIVLRELKIVYDIKWVVFCIPTFAIFSLILLFIHPELILMIVVSAFLYFGLLFFTKIISTDEILLFTPKLIRTSIFPNK